MSNEIGLWHTDSFAQIHGGGRERKSLGFLLFGFVGLFFLVGVFVFRFAIEVGLCPV